MNIVGRFVELARQQHTPKLTQENLATRLQLLGWNCDRFTVSKIERGKRQVTDYEVQMLSKTLGVSADWLLGGKE